jgi:SAM-dependent methyltransferase
MAKSWRSGLVAESPIERKSEQFSDSPGTLDALRLRIMTNSPPAERDYVLGTHDEEIERLGLQHAVWRPQGNAAWQRAGVSRGQTILDVGCGPGYATLDLAELVGPTGRVIAVDRSRRFLDVLEARAEARGAFQVAVMENDLDEASFENAHAHGAWCRWVLAFVMQPRQLLARIARGLESGATFVSHEYYDYGSWRTLPRSALFEEFVGATIGNWRKSGGEPDIGAQVPRWLEELSFEIVSVRPLVYIIDKHDFMWQWPASFMQVGLARLVELGAIEEDRAPEFEATLTQIANDDEIRMITPGVLEVIARKR